MSGEAFGGGEGVHYAVALCGDAAIRHLHTPRYIRGDIMPWRKEAAARVEPCFQYACKPRSVLLYAALREERSVV